jgi:DNA-binding transcriptional LysR family regulator
MNLSKVDLNLFVVFDAIYSEANLTRAGEIIGITQPAVSNSLSRLRSMFDDPLFVRTAKGMTPTPAARNIIGPIRQALTLMRSSVQDSDSFCAETSNKLYRLSMTDLTEATVLPQLFKVLRRQAPNIDVESYVVKRRDMPRELASGNLDLAVDAPLVTDAHVNHTRLIADRWVCVVRQDHKQLNGTLSMDKYLALNHIQVSTRKRGLGHVDLELGKMGLRRRIALRTRHYHITPDIIEKTDLALTVQLRFANQITQRFNLKYLQLPFDVPPLETHLYWHESADQDPANKWMRNLLQSFFLSQESNHIAATGE